MKKESFLKFWGNIYDFSWNYIQYVGFAISTLAVLFSANLYYTLLAIGVFLYVTGAILEKNKDEEIRKKAARLENVEEKLEDAQQANSTMKANLEEKTKKLFRSILKIIVNKNLSFKGSERISIFLRSSENFILVARYSEHPEYTTTGRHIFPFGAGSISKAWKGPEGYNYSCELPDKNAQPEKYYAFLENKHNIQRKVAEEFRMPSRFYYSRVIYNLEEDRIGVLVVESEEPSKYEKGELDSFYEGNKKLITQFIHINKNLILTQ